MLDLSGRTALVCRELSWRDGLLAAFERLRDDPYPWLLESSLAGDLDEIPQDRVRGSDVDEYDLLALEVERIDQIVVAVRDVAGIASPGSPHRPRRAEAVGTTRVIETPPLHGQ